MAETVKWMLENLKEGSQFCSVLGNHDMDQLSVIIHSKREEQENSIEWQLMNMLPMSEDEVFYTLVDAYFENGVADVTGLSWEAWYFATLFYKQYLTALCRKDVEVPDFQNARAKQAYFTIRERFKEGDPMEIVFEAEQYIGVVRKKIHRIVPEYWVANRDRFC